MSLKSKLIAAGSIIALSTTVAFAGNAVAQNAEPAQSAVFDVASGQGGPQGSRFGRRGGPGGRGGPNLVERFDTNGDGSISQAEIAAVKQAKIAEFDTNGDGSLSLAEYEALWLDRNRERLVDSFQRTDADGNAIITLDEFGFPTDRLFARLDRDGDGVIGEDELRPRRRGPGGRGPGGRGPGGRGGPPAQ